MADTMNRAEPEIQIQIQIEIESTEPDVPRVSRINDISTVDLDTSSSTCHWCKGSGKRNKRQPKNNEGKRLLSIVKCAACNGQGTIVRTKRTRNNNGEWRSNRLIKAYPSFVAPGPAPYAVLCGNSTNTSNDSNITTTTNNNTHTNNPGMDPSQPECGPDEELCCLVGMWKVFQKLDKHRYSTDDLVTSHIACKWSKKLQHCDPNVLDIGCGLGSVLLCTAWQLPGAKCVGIETQPPRFELARRNIEFNLGPFPSVQQRVCVIHGDLRSTVIGQIGDSPGTCTGTPTKFDVVTGTPPYFPAGSGIAPSTGESTGCLYECKGGVEVYCAAASRYLRQPGVDNYMKKEGAVNPSVFVLCNTAITSLRVYVACQQNDLSIIERVDVIPRTGKPVLFCVFVVVANAWLASNATAFPFPTLNPEIKFDDSIDITILDPSYRVPEGVSLRGEIVTVMTVREPKTTPNTGNGSEMVHSAEYSQLLRDLGKPCSADREVFSVNVTTATVTTTTTTT